MILITGAKLVLFETGKNKFQSAKLVPDWHQLPAVTGAKLVLLGTRKKTRQILIPITGAKLVLFGTSKNEFRSAKLVPDWHQFREQLLVPN